MQKNSISASASQGGGGTTNFLRRPAVENKTGLSRSIIYRLMSEGKFPKPLRVTVGRVIWLESEIEEWQAQRIAEREA